MNRYLKILLVGNYLWYFGAGLLGPLYAVFVQSIGGDILDLVGAYAAYLIVMGIVSILVGKISDHHSKKKIMLVGCGLYAIATFGYLLIDTPVKLFLIQILLGIACALSTPTWCSLYSKHLDDKHYGEEWGFNEGGSEILYGVAVLIGGLIVSYLSFTVLFIAMGSIQIITTIILSRTLCFNHKNSKKRKRTMYHYIVRCHLRHSRRR